MTDYREKIEKNSGWLRLLILVLATVFALQYLAGLEPQKIVNRITDANPVILGFGTAVYIVSWPLRGYRYRRILESLSSTERTGFLTGAIFISQTVNLVFPARAGDATRAYIIKKRRNVRYTTGVASLAAERVFDLVAVLTLGGIGVLGILVIDTSYVSVNRNNLVILGVVVITVLLGMTAVFGAVFSERLRQTAGNLPYLGRITDSKIADSFTEFRGVLSDRKSFSAVFGTSLLIWFLDVATAYLIFFGFEVSSGPYLLLAVSLTAVSFGNLAKIVPLTPGGIGTYEAAFAVIVISSTPINWATALGVGIVDHAIKNFVTLGGGISSGVYYNLSLTKTVEKQKDEKTAADGGEEKSE